MESDNVNTGTQIAESTKSCVGGCDDVEEETTGAATVSNVVAEGYGELTLPVRPTDHITGGLVDV